MSRMSAVGTEQQAASPRTKGDEVQVLFKLFDADGDGKVTDQELKSVLQSLDAELWTDERVNKIIREYDDSQDGALQFTEFWGWVCGHGGKSTADFRPTLLTRATEEDRRRREENQRKLEVLVRRRKEREEKAAEAAKKEAERCRGSREAKTDFIDHLGRVGLPREVALGLFNAADANRDGDIDRQELLWVAADKAATTSQIRALYQQATGGTVDAKSNLDMKTVQDQGIQAIVDAFSAWDVNGDGTIEASELARVLQTLNPRLGLKTVEALRKEMDADQNGSIDIVEFLGWLTGEHTKKAKMKKKAKDEQECKLALAMHRKRAEEARKEDKQQAFEEAMHSYLKPWCERKKLNATCGNLYTGPGAPQLCKACGDRHGWLCHGCGFVSFSTECCNGCQLGKFGWSCIDGNCGKKKCGCKKKPEHWQRAGRVHELAVVSNDVTGIVASTTARAGAPAGESPAAVPADAASLPAAAIVAGASAQAAKAT